MCISSRLKMSRVRCLTQYCFSVKSLTFEDVWTARNVGLGWVLNLEQRLWLWQSWGQSGERDESAIILTSCSESQRVHCPGKIGRDGGRGQGRSSDLLIISHQTQPTFRRRKIHWQFLHCFYLMFAQRRLGSRNTLGNWEAIIIQESVSIHPWEDTIACLSPCLSGDNNLQFQNILTPQLSLSALAICLSWTQFIVNNYSRIVY